MKSKNNNNNNNNQMSSLKRMVEEETYGQPIIFDSEISFQNLSRDNLIRGYKFVLQLEELESGKTSVAAQKRLTNIQMLRLRLEAFPLIQQYISGEIPKTQDEEIKEIVDLVEEKQKLRKMGPIGRFVYQKKKNRRG